MKKSNKVMIAAAAALGLSTMAFAGQGMGAGNCGQGKHNGQGMHQGKGMQSAQDNCGNRGQGQRMGNKGMHKGQGRHGRHGGMQKIMSQLDLSDAQRQQIRQIMQESRAGMQGQGMGRKQGMNNGMGQGMYQGQGKGMNQGQGQKMGKQGHKGMRGAHQRQGIDASKFMTKDSFDKEAFKKAKMEKWAQQDEMRKQRRAARLDRMADRMEKIFKVLTPEQREKLIELSQKGAAAQ